MAFSRLNRLQDRKEKRRLLLAVVGIIAVFTIILLFGVKALIGFSLLVDKLRGGAPTASQQSQLIILPPTIDPPPTATNSATISVTGKGQTGFTLILYVNNSEFKRLAVKEDGTFMVPNVSLTNGTNTISAKLTDAKDNVSDLSNIVSVTYGNTPPKLIISDPTDNTTISGDQNTVTVNGMTDDNVTVTINDRMVVIKTDNSFSYNYPLNEGDNILKIVATDTAGNQTTLERKVTYHK
jgi:bacillopeptidase F